MENLDLHNNSCCESNNNGEEQDTKISISNKGESIGSNTIITNTILEKIGPQSDTIGVFGTLILVGPQTKSTREHIDKLYFDRDNFEKFSTSQLKTNMRKRIRNPDTESESCDISTVAVTHLNYGYGKNRVNASKDSSQFSVVRFKAMNAEHGYRLMHKLLIPLEPILGFIPYMDRI